MFVFASTCDLQLRVKHEINTQVNANILIHTDQHANVFTFQHRDQCTCQHSDEFPCQRLLLKTHMNTYMDKHSRTYILATANANIQQTDITNH